MKLFETSQQEKQFFSSPLTLKQSTSVKNVSPILSDPDLKGPIASSPIPGSSGVSVIR